MSALEHAEAAAAARRSDAVRRPAAPARARKKSYVDSMKSHLQHLRLQDEALSVSPDIILRINRRGLVDFASPAACALLRRDSDGLLGTPLAAWLAPATMARDAALLRGLQGAPSQHASPVSIELRREDGLVLPCTGWVKAQSRTVEDEVVASLPGFAKELREAFEHAARGSSSALGAAQDGGSARLGGSGVGAGFAGAHGDTQRRTGARSVATDTPPVAAAPRDGAGSPHSLSSSNVPLAGAPAAGPEPRGRSQSHSNPGSPLSQANSAAHSLSLHVDRLSLSRNSRDSRKRGRAGQRADDELAAAGSITARSAASAASASASATASVAGDEEHTSAASAAEDGDDGDAEEDVEEGEETVMVHGGEGEGDSLFPSAAPSAGRGEIMFVSRGSRSRGGGGGGAAAAPAAGPGAASEFVLQRRQSRGRVATAAALEPSRRRMSATVLARALRKGHSNDDLEAALPQCASPLHHPPQQVQSLQDLARVDDAPFAPRASPAAQALLAPPRAGRAAARPDDCSAPSSAAQSPSFQASASAASDLEDAASIAGSAASAAASAAPLASRRTSATSAGTAASRRSGVALVPRAALGAAPEPGVGGVGGGAAVHAPAAAPAPRIEGPYELVLMLRVVHASPSESAALHPAGGQPAGLSAQQQQQQQAVLPDPPALSADLAGALRALNAGLRAMGDDGRILEVDGDTGVVRRSWPVPAGQSPPGAATRKHQLPPAAAVSQRSLFSAHCVGFDVSEGTDASDQQALADLLKAWRAGEQPGELCYTRVDDAGHPIEVTGVLASQPPPADEHILSAEALLAKARSVLLVERARRMRDDWRE